VSIYPYKKGFKIQGHHQYDTLAHCRVQLAVQRFSNAAPTHSRVTDLFGIASSQESNDGGFWTSSLLQQQEASGGAQCRQRTCPLLQRHQQGDGAQQQGATVTMGITNKMVIAGV
jgi:hypothetical protein